MRFKNIKIIILYLLLVSSNRVLSQSQFTLDGATKFVLNTGTKVVLTGGTNLNNAASEIIINAGSVIISGQLQGPGSFNGMGASTLELNGTGNGVLNFSAGANTLNMLTLNRVGSMLTLNTPLTISGLFTLQNGVLNTSLVNLPTLGTGGGATGTLNYSGGQVNGPFRRWFDALANSGTSGDFPIGDGITLFNPRIEFTSAPGTAGTLTAQWINTCPGFTGLPLLDGALNLVSANTAGYWKIDAGNGLSGGTYTSALAANNFPGITDFSTLRTVKRPAGGGNWVINGTAGTNTGTNAAPVIVRQGMTGFGEFGIGAAADNTTLSITLSCPGNQAANTASNACSAVVSYTASASGPGSPVISYEFSGATSGSGSGTGSGTVFNKGVTNVKLTAVTSCESTSCQFTVTVTDNNNPIITCPASAIRNTNAGLCTYKVQNTEFNATATDNCAVTSLSYVLSGATTGSGTGTMQTLKDVLLNIGTTTVTWTAKDAANNTVSCTFTVTVLDDQNGTNYIIYATEYAEFGEYNYIVGDVGVTAANGNAKFRKNSVLDPFTITAADIDVQMPALVNNRVLSPATGGPTPSFMVYNGNTTALSNIEVTVNGTLNGNWKDVKVKKGITCTITGNNFGRITIEEGASVTFTAAVINLEKMDVQKGKKQDNILTVVNYSNPAWIKVKDKIEIGDDCHVNAGGPKVTFYVGDNAVSDLKFEVMGENSQVRANIMIPKGKLLVQGGNSASRSTIMTGWYIIEKLESRGKYVYWNRYDCGAPGFTIVQQSTQPEITTPVTQPADEFRVNVYPNPAAYEFNIQVISKSNEPVTVRVLDMNGKVLSVYAKQTKSNSIRVGDKLVGGTYMAEVIQGANRKMVKLVKMN